MQQNSIRKELTAYFLFPLALIYWGVIYWRNLFYKYGFFISNNKEGKLKKNKNLIWYLNDDD